MRHPTAIIHPGAQVDPSVEVGPFAVIEDGVVVGPQCRLWPYVHLSGLTTIGDGNQFHTGCVIGNIPQDLKFKGDPSRLRIGDQNTFRENVTVNRSTSSEGETVIGSNNLLMAGAHVGHDCRVGNHTIIVNGALLGGHVEVGDRAVISGNCCVHQFVRVGTLAMMQGGAAVSKDLPPYTLARGDNHLAGLNTIGLRRAGLTSEQRLELRQLFHLLFRSGKVLREAVEEARGRFKSPVAKVLIDFAATNQRGLCAADGLGRTGRASGAAGEEGEES
jgi:UDP-N-acetylglucosamine acyltransferase